MRQYHAAFRQLMCHRQTSMISSRFRSQLLILSSFSDYTPALRKYSKFSTHLSTERAMELLCNLDEEERSNLRCALGKVEADKEKKLYESQLAVGSWRTRFGRLSNKPALGQVIAGTFCAVPDDWLRRKLVESAAPPTAGQLYSIFFVNAVPFIAFGFLDNFIMIMAGEYIEYYLGHFITLSTMAAAGLGNTISDILGITMATYVENGCQILGLKQPKLTPAQFELKSSKRSSSFGRIVGITVGCLLGMCPLWFMEEKASEKTDAATN
ncbi:transmembrane protein 65 isoform X1 [Drosophila kikkawai]|uniref:Transmembrane protein 65 isoform X1 n=1 Tax=Drosophila kikkawai TaxID=30033 RepID=A0A6P4IT74_DROKI|nr:transmembrane protein 65 isoform X1 [Drosophila kikkawai]